MRLAWCRGSGKAAGWLKLSKSGAVLVRGPVDACVGSPERLSYEGAAVVGNGLTRLPRIAQVIGGKGMLCAADLLEFADRHAPADRYDDRITDAKNDPEFRARASQAAGDTPGDAHQTGGDPRRAARAGGQGIRRGDRRGDLQGRGTDVLPLTGEHTLYWPNGKSFTVADIQKEPAAFHGKECCDPVEGITYQSRNCAIIYTNGAQLEIYSRAHGDAFAYVATLDEMSWAELFAQLRETHPPEAAADEPAGSARALQSSSSPSTSGPSSSRRRCRVGCYQG